MDKALRHGQVGGLGDKMENMIDTEKYVPIFEFRDLDRVRGTAMIDLMTSFEDKTIEYHQRFAQAENINDKPEKGMSLSIVLLTVAAGSFPTTHLESKWEFYTTKVG